MNDFSNNTKFDESTTLDVSYDKVKKIQSIKPTIHKYLSGYVRSRFRRIDADEFVIATLLPVQRFKKRLQVKSGVIVGECYNVIRTNNTGSRGNPFGSAVSGLHLLY